MEQDVNSGDRYRFDVHQQISNPGREVFDLNDELRSLFHQAVERRDGDYLKTLVIEQYPRVPWGTVFDELPQEDHDWALRAVGVR